VGGAAQTKAVKSVSGGLKLSLAQFRELASFAQFSSDLDDETKQRIERGQRLTELLKQKQYQPLSIAEQVVSLMAATKGAFDTVPTEKIKDAQAELISYMEDKHGAVVKTLNKGDKPTEDIEKTVLGAAEKVAKGYAVRTKAVKTEGSKK
jgi:F-type H+-transporting ATPase subunit alpha